MSLTIEIGNNLAFALLFLGAMGLVYGVKRR